MKITVVDSETKKPLENAKVTYDGKTYTTNAKGEVTISNVKPGDVTVDGSDDNYQNGSTKVEVTPNGQDDGKTYTTNAKGEVTISNVKPGDVTVDGSDDNYQNGSTKVEVTPNGQGTGIISLTPDVEVTPNGQGTGIISLTPDNGTMNIKVVDSKTKKALSKATVNIDGQTLHTNSNGEVQISNVKPGDVKATGSDEGYTNGQTSVNLDPNGKATGTISLNPEAGKVVVTVNGENGPLRNTKVIVNGVKPGDVKATASDEGYNNGQTSVKLDPNGKVTGTISLNPEAGKVVVTVNGENGPLKNTKVTVNGSPETTNGVMDKLQLN